MKTCRVLVNTPSSQGGIGDLYNFKLTPSLTLGCGSWGGNSVSENVGVKHLLNIKTVAERRENMLWFRAPQKVYFKKGCLPVALDELGTVMGKKRAFIVTDSFLYNNGYTKPIEKSSMRWASCTRRSPTSLPTRRSPAPRRHEADGASSSPTPSSRSAAVPLWTPARSCGCSTSIPRLTSWTWQCASSISASVSTPSPRWAKRPIFVAIPTSAGTGSEVTPFAVITDETTGVKYPLADYELLPNMAIIDADMMMTAPKGLTALRVSTP